MPLQPKPKVDEQKIQEVISRGLFLPGSILAEVDAIVKTVRPKTSRRAWLVETIRAKVEEEKTRNKGEGCNTAAAQPENHERKMRYGCS